MPRAAARPLRVAHLTTIDLSLVALLGRELRHDVERGCEVLAVSAPGPRAGQLEALGVRPVHVPALTRSWSLREDLRAAVQLLRVLRRERPDVLHTHTPKPGVLGRVVGRLAGVPAVVNTCHGLYLRPADGRLRRTAVLAAEGAAALFSHAELFQNPDDARLLRRAVGRRGRVVGNGTDLDRFRPDATARARVRAELGVGPDTVLIGGVGRLVREKGVLDLADAARRLAAEPGLDVVVVWIGPQDAEDLDPSALGGLRLLPFRSDLERWYPGLDVFVLPSYREGFPRSAMEAAACGTASVLTDIRGCREVGRDGHELLLVPPGDPAALAVALRRLAVDPALRARLAAALRVRALERFDQRRVAEESLAAYGRVLARRQRRLRRWRRGAPLLPLTEPPVLHLARPPVAVLGRPA